MNANRFVGLRGTKSRLFLYFAGILFLGLVVYLYHDCQLQMGDLRQTSEKCQQQQESLSAQLQVIFEYKLRLEKSLQQEKNDHRQTKEDLQSKALEEKMMKDKSILESMNKYTSLQQQHKLLKSQHDDLDEECNKVRISQLQGLEEKSKLETQVQAVQQEVEQIQAAREKELEDLKSHYLQLEVELDRLSKLYKEQSSKSQQSTNTINYLQKQVHQLEREVTDSKGKLKSCLRDGRVDTNMADSLAKLAPQSPVSKTTAKTTAAGVRDSKQGHNFVVEAPDRDVADKAGLKSTTPQINPDAINSLDRAVASANGGANGGANSKGGIKENGANNNVVPMPPPAAPRQDNVALPAGVVPAPLGYENRLFKPNNEADANAWDWAYKKPEQQHDNLLRFQYLKNQHNVHNHQNVDLNNQQNVHNLKNVDLNHLNNLHNRENVDLNNVHNLHDQQNVDLNNQPNLYNHQNIDFNNVHNLPNQRNVDLNNQRNLYNHQNYDIHNQQNLHNRQNVDINNRHADFNNKYNAASNNRQNAGVNAHYNGGLNERNNELFLNANNAGLNERRNAADMANDLQPQRAARARFEEEQQKHLPRQGHNAYPYQGDYEKEGNRNDLHLEEAEEEGDDDLDQLDYGNDGAKQNNNLLEPKRPAANFEEQRDGVMVNPK